MKKVSRKDISKMSFREFLRASRAPYQRLFSYLTPYRGRFFLGILFGALYGAVQGLLIFDVQFVAARVFPNAKSHLPTAIENMVPFLKDWHFDHSLGAVLLVCSTIPIIMALRGLFSYLNSYCMLWVSVRILDDIRQQVFRRTLQQAMAFHDKSRAGELVQTVFNQTRMAQQALTTISGDVVKQPIAIVTAFGVLLAIDWRFTLASCLIFPLCLIPVVLVSKKVRKAGAREEEEAGQLMVVMQEAFSGIRVVKTHGREDFECARFDRANAQIMEYIMRWRKAMELSAPAVETIASLGVAAALVWVWAFDLGFDKFIALNGGMVLMYPPFKAMSRVHLTMQKCLAATTKVFELLDTVPAIQDAPDAVPLVRASGEIVLQNVSFTYAGRQKAALEDCTLRIPAGQTVALVGATGAGKSTVLSLIQRLYEPQTGSIQIDGLDLRKVTQHSLRDNIAVVTQDVFLFHDTIFENIRYSRLDATKEEIENAARLAHAHEFILAQQPDGYQTLVGDKGCNLSGGQKQRISIARALLKDAPILLLDEAMSALDSETEQHIQAALDTLCKGRTVVAIAHRLSTIVNADQIVVMEDGCVKEIGKHVELYSQSPYYKRLCDLQFPDQERSIEPSPAPAT